MDYDLYIQTLRLAEAELAVMRAQDELARAAVASRQAEREVYLPRNKPFSVQVGDKTVTVTRVGPRSDYEYCVSTTLSE